MIYNLVAFAIGFVVMSFEFVAARTLSAHFGGATMVWGGLISVVMGGLCLGSTGAAFLAKKGFSTRDVSFYILLAAAAVAVCSHVQKSVVVLIMILFSFKTAILLSAIFLYLVPAILLGSTSPMLVHLASLRNPKLNAGYLSGMISAWGTLGSIVGTIVVSFYWIPAMGLLQIGYSLAAILLMVAVFIGVGVYLFAPVRLGFGMDFLGRVRREV